MAFLPSDSATSRVILGTAAIKDPEFLDRMIDKYKEKIAVGVDFRDGKVAVKGWQELSDLTWIWSSLFCGTSRTPSPTHSICSGVDS